VQSTNIFVGIVVHQTFKGAAHRNITNILFFRYYICYLELIIIFA